MIKLSLAGPRAVCYEMLYCTGPRAVLAKKLRIFKICLSYTGPRAVRCEMWDLFEITSYTGPRAEIVKIKK